MRIAIYARVSTSDQDCGMQLSELRDYCRSRRWEVAAEYVDRGQSGAKASRPELDRCMRDARKHRFDLVLVWALDRWGRSTTHLLQSIRELSSYGVGWMSYTQGLDTSKSNPTGQLVLTILGAVAEFERAMIQERVRAGVAQAKRRGKHCGRPRAIFRRDEARRLRSEGRSWREIARALGVSHMTVKAALSGV